MNEPMPISRLYPTPAVSHSAKRYQAAEVEAPTTKSFGDVLRGELKLSRHAELRLKQRGVNLKPEQMEQIRSAIDKAEAKGAKDSLILMKDMALIVNVKNRTIVTAMDGASMKENVFTQIDSAIILT
ncbi:MAG: flagellar biosynthesis protein [Gorillibacterium sp.]|nr:flagellar biosynthesis protein [Gorillibacterium sp.]